MPDSADLTPSESALLIVLLAEARDVSNAELKERFQLTLTGRSRVKLNGLKYVESWKDGQTFVHRLGEEGWARCRAELNFDSPRAKALGAALSSLVAAVHRDLARTSRSLADAFAPPEQPTAGADPVATELVTRIRAAYRSLAGAPGAWVSLADLRVQLDAASPAEIDEALRLLNRAPDVNLVPESNQKALTEADRRSAVYIGGQHKHFLAIGV